MNTSIEEKLESIAAMRFQEDTGYVTRDWMELQELEAPNGGLGFDELVDTDCRFKMVSWCYQVAECCKLQKDTVEITLSYVDRFLCTQEGVTARNDRWVFQLAFMSAFYTAVKLHEPRALAPDLIASFSHGVYTPADIETMESKILKGLQWRVNPPTSTSFVRMMLDLLVSEGYMKQEIAAAASELSQIQTQAASANYALVTVRASTLAYSAVMNSLECLNLSQSLLGPIGYSLAQPLFIDCNSTQIVNVQSVLYEAVAQRPILPVARTFVPHASTCVRRKSRRGSVEISPRGVEETP